jgi:hypothetical protein
MMYNTIQINRLRQQEMRRAAEQERLANIAREAHRSHTQTSIASRNSVLDEMGRGLMALGLIKASPEEPQIA